MLLEIKIFLTTLTFASILAITGFGLLMLSPSSAGAFDVIDYCNNTPTPPDCQTNNPCPAGSTSPVCQDAANKGNTDPVSGPNGLIHTAANIIAIIAGIAAVVAIIISGLIFVTAGGTGFKSSGGSPTRAAKARSVLVYSVIGLIVVALGWTITTFITDKFVQS